ncbi:hypothetical protein ORV05_21905 [Amycolatopsis cynarae]|uniref:Ada DNA repair metal-binding domain-containing protein n=1 Tax=Amycolatopsis cynarae TaxID=2995223 RepID=A0ABY7AXL4_9PSEU|nr:hypothetical protein [Amycolatopsis sp. HUAS 11-8]WAL63652.1 hypothetical protein ORV05_21905 [Amycolatopsis sp. HUAS 11-8]
MLYIVLILVLAALGLLIAALITANALWAWVSIGLSVLAGLFLVVDYLRRRRRRRRPETEEAGGDGVGPDKSAPTRTLRLGEEAGDATEATEATEIGEAGEVTEVTEVSPPGGEGAEAEGSDAAERGGPGESAGGPGEEPTAPEDAQVVARLETEVVVVDEYPRYHFPDCAWLEARATIPLVVKEARELGFTPCARCTPDARLIAAHRTEPAS